MTVFKTFFAQASLISYKKSGNQHIVLALEISHNGYKELSFFPTDHLKPIVLPVSWLFDQTE